MGAFTARHEESAHSGPEDHQRFKQIFLDVPTPSWLTSPRKHYCSRSMSKAVQGPAFRFLPQLPVSMFYCSSHSLRGQIAHPFEHAPITARPQGVLALLARGAELTVRGPPQARARWYCVASLQSATGGNSYRPSWQTLQIRLLFFSRVGCWTWTITILHPHWQKPATLP